MKQQIITVIKPIAIGVVVGALGLELWHDVAAWMSYPPPPGPALLLWYTRFALIGHAIEAAIAMIYAPSRHKRPWQYGLYTFFVGTVALIELFDIKPVAIKPEIN